MESWLTPGAITGTIALVVSMLALRYTRRVDIRQAKTEQPTVSIDLTKTASPEWYRLTITVRNRTDAVWLLETIHAPHWESAKMELESKLTERLTATLEPDRSLATFEPVVLNERVQPSSEGTPGQASLHLLLSVERGLTQEIGIHLRMRSLAEMRRSTEIIRLVTPI